MTRPTAVTDQQDRGYAANVAALRFSVSRSALERESIDTALTLARLHFAWSEAMRGKTKETA